jgi:myosin-5
MDEGLKDHLTTIKYTDNQSIIDLIDKPPVGIFDSIDDSCQIGTGTDDQLLKKICTSNDKNPSF